jgi:hypothetical protein
MEVVVVVEADGQPHTHYLVMFHSGAAAANPEVGLRAPSKANWLRASC